MAKQMTDSNSTPTHEQIARRAYEIFIERGQPEGQDLAHWLEAERQLRASGEAKSNGAQAPAASTASTAIRAAAASQSSNSNGRGTTTRAPRAGVRK